MDTAVVKKWAAFFIGILVAILIADRLSSIIIKVTGFSGVVQFLLSFILYALFFFAILYVIQKVFRVDFFGFNRE
ncbi:hypothetical protein [uncultured Methanoregula sp.]|uniref:hypothetical protein n=1 Tax=uncultured Methanoregula sp. TaxID=1005933 RepID=UPI002AAC0783|nr:hypothetical protein [uncultured Methanoregula sp.]